MSTDRAPDISVVIVSWNVRDLLAQCLDSLLAIAGPEPLSGDALRLGQRVLDVWVVDNASHDATLAMLADQYPWVHAIVPARTWGSPAAITWRCRPAVAMRCCSTRHGGDARRGRRRHHAAGRCRRCRAPDVAVVGRAAMATARRRAREGVFPRCAWD